MANRSLLEAYAKRINYANDLYKKSHGEDMDLNRKTILATCIDNTRKFLSESFQTSQASQRADLGNYKVFCTNLINVSIPNCITPDLVITKPMTSITGYLTY